MSVHGCPAFTDCELLDKDWKHMDLQSYQEWPFLIGKTGNVLMIQTQKVFGEKLFAHTYAFVMKK